VKKVKGKPEKFIYVLLIHFNNETEEVFKLMKIGIPRSLLYHHYHDIWDLFFTKLGCELIYSPKTTKSILEQGKKHIVDESCLSMKIHMGHVDYLSQKCDYILVPYIDRYSKTDSLCANFYGIYDLAKTIFPDRIIHYHIDLKRNNERKAYIAMARELGFSKTEAGLAYDEAKANATDLHEKAVIENKKLLKNSKKIKIIIVGHLYNVYDDFVGNPIISYLNKNDVDVIFAHLNDAKEEYKKISETLYWKYNKELLNGVVAYEKDVDGIILLTTFPCGPDSLVNELCLQKVTKPAIQLIIDELNSGTGLETRLESFVDILEQRKGDAS